jgi:hypothetical protein
MPHQPQRGITMLSPAQAQAFDDALDLEQEHEKHMVLMGHRKARALLKSKLIGREIDQLAAMLVNLADCPDVQAALRVMIEASRDPTQRNLLTVISSLVASGAQKSTRTRLIE